MPFWNSGFTTHGSETALVLLAAILVIGCDDRGPVASADNVAADAAQCSASLGTLEPVIQGAATEFFEAAPRSVGLSVGVICGSDIETFHLGTTQPGVARSPTDRTIYPIASITKTVTGSLLARAVVDDLLALDDDIRDYLDGPYPNLEYDGRPITVAHLMNHSSGLPHLFPDRAEMHWDHPSYEGDVLPWMAYVTAELADYSADDFRADLASVRLEAAPGTRFGYSNAAFQLAGSILERVYDRSFAELVESMLTKPLAMEDTVFALDSSQADRIAIGYDERGRIMPTDRSASGAAGGLMSTIVDLARYARWNLDEGNAAVRLGHTALTGAENGPEMGLGWYLHRSADGVPRVSSDGTVPGYSSRIVVYPDLDLGLVLLTNQLDFSILRFTERLADDVLEALDARAFRPGEASAR